MDSGVRSTLLPITTYLLRSEPEPGEVQTAAVCYRDSGCPSVRLEPSQSSVSLHVLPSYLLSCSVLDQALLGFNLCWNLHCQRNVNCCRLIVNGRVLGVRLLQMKSCGAAIASLKASLKTELGFRWKKSRQHRNRGSALVGTNEIDSRSMATGTSPHQSSH